MCFLLILNKTNIVYYLAAIIILENKHRLMKWNTHKELVSFDYSLINYDAFDLVSKSVALHEKYNDRFIDELSLSCWLETPEMPSFGFVRSFPLPQNSYPVLIRYPQSKPYSSMIVSKVKKEQKYEDLKKEENNPEITPTLLTHAERKSSQPINKPLYGAANLPVPIEILNSKTTSKTPKNGLDIHKFPNPIEKVS